MGSEMCIRDSQMAYQTEKTLKELGNKLPASDKAAVERALNHLKETLKGNDTQAIKSATDALTKEFYAVSEKLYGQQGGQGGPGPDMGGGFNGGAQGGYGGQGGSAGGDNVVDADYEVVDDDNNK